jgi:hypothetical protein
MGIVTDKTIVPQAGARRMNDLPNECGQVKP